MLLSSRICLGFSLGCMSGGVCAAGSPGGRSLRCLESSDRLRPAPAHSRTLSADLPLCWFWFASLLGTVPVLLSPGRATQQWGCLWGAWRTGGRVGPGPGPQPTPWPCCRSCHPPRLWQAGVLPPGHGPAASVEPSCEYQDAYFQR